MQFKDNHALVTGGGSGIGLAISKALVAAGARVTITGRDARKLDAVASKNPGIAAYPCDVTDNNAILALRDSLLGEGGIDILINNAGIMAFFSLLDPPPLQEQVDEINIDAVGPVRMVQHFLPSLLERQSTIINVSSGLAYVPYAKAPVYSAAKSFLHAYTQCLREQLKGTSVRVVELLPPVVDTPLAAGVPSPFPRMPPDVLAAVLMKGLRCGKLEIAPGISTPLKWMSRLLPGFAFRQMNKPL
jgi:uncharacterized oxidoreductase